MAVELFKIKNLLKLEFGSSFSELELAYHSYGSLNSAGDNVIWVFHALTANSDPQEWWPGMIGKGYLFDPEDYYIICVNIVGSCYGSTGPLSTDPETGKPYFRNFPLVSYRDLVQVYDKLRKYLGIKKIHTAIGGSIGGAQAIEYSIIFPDLIQHLIVIGSGAAASPWRIASTESQRLAIEADSGFYENEAHGGKKGLKAARAMALLGYRNAEVYNKTQAEENDEVYKNFKVQSYQIYQGEKLINRFDAYSYYSMLKMSDTHNVGRGRGGQLKALTLIKAKTLAIGISTDHLFPVEEQKFLANNIEKGTYVELDSFYGHDGFLIEVEKITEVVRKFYNS
ncbi:MAG: homoserine O-acetyltransferase [Bacteroidota bacterium]|nr:homoserine O-acetyltransferase [Bacteroidota bacterium]